MSDEVFPYVDCQGLAGAWTLGTVQTGRFKLIHRVSLPGGFGDDCIGANRHLVGDGWEQEVGNEPEWTHKICAYLNGTPPCSGFSLMNISKGRNARGPDAAINDCMKELARYAGRCWGTDGERGPQVVAFESVQQAFTNGRDLMVRLRDIISERTGNDYAITHVKMSGSSVGAAQMRHRYYPVFHRIPFGVDSPEPRKVVTYEDAIGDLVDGQLTWDAQEYPATTPSEWALTKRNDALYGDGYFDAHATVETGRMALTLEQLVGQWYPGENIHQVLQRAGKLPFFEKYWDEEKQTVRGWSWPRRVRPDKPGYVLTGGGVFGFVHYSEDRLFTVREMSRLMGYPDAWKWDTAGTVQKASMWLGKCCPVDSGKWISEWVARALDGSPGTIGNQIGDREYLFDCTNDYKRWPKEISQFDPKA
jgi:site-specific DNA-cytosine methylase